MNLYDVVGLAAIVAIVLWSIALDRQLRRATAPRVARGVAAAVAICFIAVGLLLRVSDAPAWVALPVGLVWLLVNRYPDKLVTATQLLLRRRQQ